MKAKQFQRFKTGGYTSGIQSSEKKQAQLGVPHSRIQVELGFILQAGTCQILNFAQNPGQSQSVQGTKLN